MKNSLKVILAVTSIGLMWFGNPTNTSASVYTFSVVPNMPDNQRNKDAGYYDLLMTPDQEQTVTLNYTNNTDHQVTVTADATAATTNLLGQVDYEGSQSTLDQTMRASLPSLLTLPESITLSARETKVVSVRIKMPKETLPGIVAGAITFRDKDAQEKSKTNDKASMAVKNIYAFQIVMLLRESNSSSYTANDILQGGMKLNTVGAGQVNYRNVINAGLQNPLACYINDMVVDAKVTSLDTKKVVLTSHKTKMQMAPNSSFDYPMYLGDGERLKAGKYRLNMTVYAQKNKDGVYVYTLNKKPQKYDYKWTFTKIFTIQAEQALRFNAQDVTIHGISWLVWVLILVIILLIGLVIWLLWKRRKRDDEEEA